MRLLNNIGLIHDTIGMPDSGSDDDLVDHVLYLWIWVVGFEDEFETEVVEFGIDVLASEELVLCGLVGVRFGDEADSRRLKVEVICLLWWKE